MIQNELHIPEKQLRIIFATKDRKPPRRHVLLTALRFLSVPNIHLLLERRDPEKPHWRMEYKEESSSDDAERVVKEKIDRVREGMLFEGEQAERSVIVASDVGFYLNDEKKHQIIRTAQDAMRFAEEPWELDRERLRVVEEFSMPFRALWHVLFAISDSSKKTFLLEAMIHHSSPGLPKKKIYDNFFPQANTGVKLVEMLEEEGGDFEVVFKEKSQRQTIGSSKVSPDLARQFIVDKFPPSNVFFENFSERQSLGIFTIGLINAVNS